ncbi:hypothetical protein EB796_024088 [Bugula neritina]|uniref:Uncharacterized protein n=1 Tax=Bugula neritina TaxID=10212 RepID=A0A7J7IVK7_BUGNE|nr:hypothetical protein EB796_024088 [Bugula neritina]
MPLVLLTPFCSQTDDVYVGIVADRVDNVYRYPLNEFYSMEYGDTNLNMASWQLDKVVFYHNPYIHDMYTLWSVDCDFSACS